MGKTARLFILLLFCSIALSGGILCLNGNNSALSSQAIEAEVFFDTTDADPNFDARAALGEDVIQQLNRSAPGTIVAYNGLTDEITIKENLITPHTNELEPYIPEGIEVADNPALTRGIIGPDSREQITGSSLNQYPYCTIAYLELTYQDGVRGTASGAFIGNTAILTAGHVVYDQTHGWAKLVKVIPGGSQSNYSPVTTIGTT